MFNLSPVADVASIAGFVLSVVTLILVARLRTALKRQSRHKHLIDIIDRILQMRRKETLPDSTCQRIGFVVEVARQYDFSFWSFFDRKAKRLVERIEAELAQGKRREVLQDHLRLLKDEITLR
ncbi:MAG: hypothetical protein HYS13_20115 [Planctomycetia bacterium]|nr:hypothetical protein [Planctomycetia bacterium]